MEREATAAGQAPHGRQMDVIQASLGDPGCGLEHDCLRDDGSGGPRHGQARLPVRKGDLSSSGGRGVWSGSDGGIATRSGIGDLL